MDPVDRGHCLSTDQLLVLQTSSRPRDVGSSFASRRGHASQLSISDPSHHVTEAIGTMYGDDDDSGAEENSGRPLSFIASSYGDHLERALKQSEPSDDRLRLVRTTSDQTATAQHTAANGGTSDGNGMNGAHVLKKSHTLPARAPSQRNGSLEVPKSPMQPLSPTPSLRDVQADSSGTQFPLTNIDNPNEIAQELSNLQALRRMSMDVGNMSDPDLLPFSSVSLVAMPSIAPTGDDDEADPSRLLWVPARVHPELEPTAFKDFLENRVQSMKRRSGESLLGADGLQRSNTSSGSLRRKKSMLSRQVRTNDSGDGYVDGAERLERQHSLSEHATPELSIDELVKDPSKAVQKLAQETRPEGGEGDMPILPVAPGMGLRRSTRTTYRKGGSVRVPFAKRVAGRQAEGGEDIPPVPDVPPVPPVPDLGQPLARVQSEPTPENFSRPNRSVRRQQNFSKEPVTSPTASSFDGSVQDEDESSKPVSSAPLSQTLPVRSVSAATQRAPVPPVPEIVETPPVEGGARGYPERSSSQKTSQAPHMDDPPARSSKRLVSTRPGQPSAPAPAKGSKPQDVSNLSEMATNPSVLPGNGASSTSSLTFIPTFDAPQKKSKDKDDTESITSTKSSSGWKWFKSDDKEKKKKEKEREREREEQARRVKSKAGDKSHDSARLDVLQNSIDNAVSKGRESLLLDRDSIDNKLHEERRKESNRKVSESKKEKDGFFGGLFGGSKKKSDKEPGQKKKEHRPLTPEPPPRQLRPDVDYAWTRFPIIEERAIYRMAHIKLANPRRPLHSQVLLSNFMYSYLAKVQAMHPNMNVPISPQQKRLEEERKRREAEQEAQRQMEQQMAAEQAAQNGNFNFEYHRVSDALGARESSD